MLSGSQNCVSACRSTSQSQECCSLLQCWFFASPEATHFLSWAVSRIQCQLKEVQKPVGKGGLVRIFRIYSRSRRRKIYVKRQNEAGNWRHTLIVITIFLSSVFFKNINCGFVVSQRRSTASKMIWHRNPFIIVYITFVRSSACTA